MSPASDPSAMVEDRTCFGLKLDDLEAWDQGQAGVRKTHSNHCRRNKKKVNPAKEFLPVC